MTDRIERAETYLARAKELLTMAGTLGDDETRTQLVAAAIEYMRMAEKEVRA